MLTTCPFFPLNSDLGQPIRLPRPDPGFHRGPQRLARRRHGREALPGSEQHVVLGSNGSEEQVVGGRGTNQRAERNGRSLGG